MADLKALVQSYPESLTVLAAHYYFPNHMKNDINSALPVRIRAVIFDLDGTLLDTIKDIATSGNQALESLGYPTHSVDRYKILVGDGISNLARKILPPGEDSDQNINRLLNDYRQFYKRYWNATSRPYPGITELLETLVEQGIFLAVLSNKSDAFTKLCVENYFPNTEFKRVYGERSGIPIKPDPAAALMIAQEIGVSPAECLFVGDSEIDLMTAKHAGMCPIGVCWGFRTPADLQAVAGVHLIEHPQEIHRYLR